jgi:hypothetical protein
MNHVVPYDDGSRVAHIGAYVNPRLQLD